ncbi:MAG: ATP-binding protein, partial [Pseudomonadota bacterium]
PWPAREEEVAMAISLDTLVRKRADKPPRLLIYGVPKIGKTSFAAEFPAPIFIQTEEGAGDLDVTTFSEQPLGSFDEVCQAIEALYTGEHGFETVVLDSLDWLEPLVWRETCAQNKWASIEAPGYGRGYVEADKHWRFVLDGLNALRERGMSVVLIAHSMVKTHQDPTTEAYDRYEIKLHKRASAMVVETVDVIGFLNYSVAAAKEEQGANKGRVRGTGSGQRVLFLDERPAFIAGSRFETPSQLPLHRGQMFGALAPYLPVHRDRTAVETAQ